LAFDGYQLIPRYLVDVSEVKTAIRVLGQNLKWPVMCSPTGASRFYHPEGELAVARASAATGTMYCLSVMSTQSFGAVARAAEGPRLFQTLIFKDRGFTKELVTRARAAGYPALCITIDAPVRGKRERELRGGTGIAQRRSIPTLTQFALRPGWFLRQIVGGRPKFANLEDRAGPRFEAQARYASEQVDPAATWADVRDLLTHWNGPCAIKGILSVGDAQRAVDVGATAIFVSNHGGRQADGVATPLDVLPQIARAVGQTVEIILDGGIRRGSHVLKALALGATACSIGRPYLYGLAAGGEAGVLRALEILYDELIGALKLCGCADLQAISPDLVQRLGPEPCSH
jgi:L-lactate dehydrogenase (cytochrome)